MSWSLAASLVVVCVIMFLGDLVSRKTSSKVSSLIVIALCFMIGFWTVFPKDILDTSMMNSLREITMLYILLQVGARFNLQLVKKDWRVVVTTLAAVAGILVIVGVAGSLIFGRETALVAIPPLTGGGMATIIMSDAAASLGLEHLAMMATIIYVLQGFVGFPLTSFFLRREGVNLLKDFRADPTRFVVEEEKTGGSEKDKKDLNSLVPEKYKSVAYYLAKLSVLAWIVTLIDKVTGAYVNISIPMILVGFLAGHFGLLEKDPLTKANSGGILQLALTASLMRYFAQSTPQQILSLIVPVAVFLFLATVGIALFSMPIGKKLGYSTNLSIAIGLNCFLGFPYNYVITNEVVGALGKTEEERRYLDSILMPKTIIGSVVAVSVVSAIVAGVVVKFL